MRVSVCGGTSTLKTRTDLFSRTRWWWGSAVISTSGARAWAASRVGMRRKISFMRGIVASGLWVARGLKPSRSFIASNAALKRRSSTVLHAVEAQAQRHKQEQNRKQSQKATARSRARAKSQATATAKVKGSGQECPLHTSNAPQASQEAATQEYFTVR